MLIIYCLFIIESPNEVKRSKGLSVSNYTYGTEL